MTEDFKMDRTIAIAQTYQEADNHTQFWDDKTPMERMNAACFIIYNIYGTKQQTKVDRTIITQRKHAN